MYCKKCGNFINDGATFCTQCGEPVSGTATPTYTPQYQQPVAQKQTNTLAIVGFILSFFFTLVGLICSIIAYKNADSQYGGNGKGLALAGIIISSIAMAVAVIWIIVAVAVLGTAASFL
ncbi:MAG: zinc-ribbon domain-containing protein [Clostridia bacterium]|nr:zinc-ribbon domain-containing protein [Clostridia bacterium]MDE6677294.1 zinc-ribbon domain-containing protein [Clostridia bacterium]